MLNLDIKPGETVVVTGCNGFIGSSVANEFLLRGYTVRGTVRSTTRCAWLLDHFAARHGGGRFSLVEIPDLTDAASYGPALASASALLVTTSAADFTQTDPDAHIPLAVAQTLAPLAAAAAAPTIKSVVLTGSGWAVSEPQACPPSSDDDATPPTTLDQFTWNDAAVAAAHAPSYADAAARGRAVFVASMVEKERAAWAWVRARAPRWRFNVVLVATVFGAIPCAARQGTPSSARFPAALLAGGEEAVAAARRRIFFAMFNFSTERRMIIS
ncbi:putative aldehyde reductase ii protein [Neofusicoccum parvum UCRNP2]|uniref:Putative aldehyde reductase ii protein n=1 Tax=Botryosphaeria parva (strain UCR-NP2) TaxID=1287680 RepID=R1GPW4_BOTPV|nr:putative aldehyde reductase ii protein [Neofusicoccum parvum UCRNP2]